MRKFMTFESNVLTGIILAGITVVSIGVLAYRTMTDIVADISEGTKPDMKLILLKDILSDLSDAESSVKTYSITNASPHLAPFYRASASIDERIRDLHELSRNDPDQHPLIDSVSMLIEEKFLILNELMLMQDDNRVEATLHMLSEKLSDRKRKKSSTRSVPVHAAARPPAAEEHRAAPAATAPPQLPQQADKRSIFEKIFGRRKKSTGDSVHRPQEQPQAARNEQAPQRGQETGREAPVSETHRKKELATVSDVQQEINRIKLQEARLTSAFKRVQLELTEKDKAVMDKIRALILRLEDKERIGVMAKTAEAERRAFKANLLIGVFCVAVSALLIILGYAIVSYTRKNTAYKKALSNAITHARNLADAKENFLANMSHEIRTPLNAIVGFTEQALKGSLQSDQREYLGIVRKSGDHLLKLINEILDLSKLGTGKLRFEHIAFRLREVLDDVVGLMKHQATEKGLRLEVHADPSIPDVLRGDPVRLRQILLNLTGNAIKFTSSGEVRITALVRSSEADGIVLQCDVADTGIGIAADKLPAIFEEFEQAESSTSRHYGGTGLGLSISRKLVEQQQGSIRAESVEGSGTLISFTLPFGIGAEAEIVSEVQPDIDSSALKGRRALVADDSEYNRKLLATILRSWEMTYTEAVDGKTALKVLEGADFDVVLMDMLMPGMDGVDTTRQIRRKMTGPKSKVPIIALTAATSEEVIRKCHDAGMNGFLSKPFKEKDLFTELVRVLQPDAATAKAVSKPMTITPPAEEETEYDLSQLRLTANGSREFMEEMIGIFIRSTREGVQAIHAAFTARKWDDVADHAHQIASPCRHIGASGMLRLITTIEEKARTGTHVRELPSLIMKLEELSARLLSRLEKERERLRVTG